MILAVTGLRAWLLQRVTAVIVAGAVVWLVVRLAFDPPQSSSVWRAWVADPVVSLSLAACFLALILHAWVGVRDIIMDYVRSVLPRVILLSLVLLSLGVMGLWMLQVLFRVAV